MSQGLEFLSNWLEFLSNCLSKKLSQGQKSAKRLCLEKMNGNRMYANMCKMQNKN